MDDDDAQPVVEVFAESALGDFFRQVLVGGGHHADIDRDVLVAAHAGEFLFLQDAEHLGLGRQAHVADLVEEERAAFGLLELALVLLDGRSESALFMAEEFALDEFARNGGAVNFHERGAGARALVVQAPGDQFLAGAVGAHDQHAGVGGGHAVHDFLDMLDGGGIAHDLVFALDFFLEADGLLDQRGLVGRILERDQDAVQVERLLDEVVGAFLDALDGSVDVAVTGNHDDRGLAAGFHQGVKHFIAIHHRHLDVAENGVEIVGKGLIHALFAVFGGSHLVAFEFQDFLECIADAPFVVDDQDLHGRKII